jgi:hypothetical protein
MTFSEKESANGRWGHSGQDQQLRKHLMTHKCRSSVGFLSSHPFSSDASHNHRFLPSGCTTSQENGQCPNRNAVCTGHETTPAPSNPEKGSVALALATSCPLSVLCVSAPLREAQRLES